MIRGLRLSLRTRLVILKQFSVFVSRATTFIAPLCVFEKPNVSELNNLSLLPVFLLSHCHRPFSFLYHSVLCGLLLFSLFAVFFILPVSVFCVVSIIIFFCVFLSLLASCTLQHFLSILLCVDRLLFYLSFERVILSVVASLLKSCVNQPFVPKWQASRSVSSFPLLYCLNILESLTRPSLLEQPEDILSQG